MTKEYLISANNIADLDRNTNEYLSVGGETVTKHDANPVVITFEPRAVAGEWNDNHTVVAEFPTAEAARAWQNDETVNSDKFERLRSAVFDGYNFYFVSEFDPADVEKSDETRHTDQL